MLRTLQLSALFLIVTATSVAQHPFFIPDNGLTIVVDSFQPNNKTGYYFIGPWSLYPVMPKSGYAIMLDKDYNIAFFKSFKNPHIPGLHGALFDFKLQPNGLMSYYWGDSLSTGFFILDSTFNIIDTLNCINHETAPNELKIQSDGSYYILCNEDSIMDLSIDTGYGKTMSSATVVHGRGAIIQQISHNKQLLFEWNAFNYCHTNEVKAGYVGASNADLDWTHGNSIFVLDDGNLLYSVRNFDQIMKISRRDSSVMWRLGGKRSDYTFPTDSGFNGQHFAYANENRIGLFDDGAFHSPPQARAVEYILDSNLHTASVYYDFRAPQNFYSTGQGSNFVLPDKGRLIDWATNVPAIIEIDSNKNRVMHINFSSDYTSYRAYYFDLPWKMYRPSIRCFSIDTQLYLVAPPTASRFIWSSGDTTRIIKAHRNNAYQVFVNYGVGLAGSEFYIVNNHTCIDTLTNIQELMNTPNTFSVQYNAAVNQLQLHFASTQDLCSLSLYDMAGRKVFESNVSIDGIAATVPLTVALSKGMYICNIHLQKQMQSYNNRVFVY